MKKYDKVLDQLSPYLMGVYAQTVVGSDVKYDLQELMFFDPVDLKFVEEAPRTDPMRAEGTVFRLGDVFYATEEKHHDFTQRLKWYFTGRKYRSTEVHYVVEAIGKIEKRLKGMTVAISRALKPPPPPGALKASTPGKKADGPPAVGGKFARVVNSGSKV